MKRNKILKYIKILIIFVILLIFLTTVIIVFNNIDEKEINFRKLVAINDVENKKFAHISIDDVIEVFDDLEKNKYDSIFQNSFLNKLKKLNEKYGAKFSLYVFYEFDSKTLENNSDRYREEFMENSDWLKFGFHCYAPNYDYNIDNDNILKEYLKTINLLEKIVGKESITKVLRLECFRLNKSNLKKLNKENKNIEGLLGADTKDRINYYLNEEENDYLFKNDYYYDYRNDIFLYNTDIRVEKLNIFGLNKFLNKFSDDENLIIFTHEWNFNYYKVDKICRWINKNYYKYEFPYELEKIL